MKKIFAVAATAAFLIGTGAAMAGDSVSNSGTTSVSPATQSEMNSNTGAKAGVKAGVRPMTTGSGASANTSPAATGGGTTTTNDDKAKANNH